MRNVTSRIPRSLTVERFELPRATNRIAELSFPDLFGVGCISQWVVVFIRATSAFDSLGSPFLSPFSSSFSFSLSLRREPGGRKKCAGHVHSSHGECYDVIITLRDRDARERGTHAPANN